MVELVDTLDSKLSSERSVGSSPTEGTKKITTGMNTKILKMLSKRVQMRTKILESGKSQYIVERKSKTSDEWDVIAKTLKFERALIKKHNAWLAQLHYLNLTSKLLRRRKYGKIKYLGINFN